MEKQTMKVKGMHCKSCEMLIKDSLEELPGIANVQADHKKGLVIFEFDKAKGNTQDVKDAIKKEGYEA
jgi:copper chaperone